MGTSAKKKREKKLDFQKPKLKVGANRPKATNSTSTSFTSKSITLKQQSLAQTSTLSPQSTFSHNLSLLSSHNESQRLSALHSLQTLLLGLSSLPPITTLLAKIQPLLLDASASVRTQALRLLRSLPSSEIGPLDQILLYIRAGLTHLSAEIRLTACDALDWLLDVAGGGVVGCAGGWVKTLKTFQNLLGWVEDDDEQGGEGTARREARGKWTAAKPGVMIHADRRGGPGGGGKLLVRQLSTLAKILRVGLDGKRSLTSWGDEGAFWPTWGWEAYRIPEKINAYDDLNLFGKVRDVDGEVYGGCEERREIFVELKMDVGFRLGLAEVKREGGEVGRAAALVENALKPFGNVR